MMRCESSEEEKYENGEEENKQESKNPDDDERKLDNGTARNTEEPQGIPLTQLYTSDIFTTGDTIPTRNGRELGEIWVSKVGTNF